MRLEDRAPLQFLGIYDDVFDPLAFPGIGHVDQAITGLYHSGIRVFIAGRILERSAGGSETMIKRHLLFAGAVAAALPGVALAESLRCSNGIA